MERAFFSTIAESETHLAIDLSYIFTESKNIPWAEIGYNSKDVWRPQVGILLMWGTTTHRPGFLKLLPGAVHSAQSLINAIWESGIQEVVAIVDKGFCSLDNMKALEDGNIEYVMALKRGLPIVHFPPPSKYRKYFFYRERVQWWCEEEWDGWTICHYLDKEMGAEEERTYLKRIEEGKVTMKDYRRVRSRFGTLSLLTDTGLSAQETYELYKQRRDTEYAFDTLFNTLGADNRWLRTRESLQDIYSCISLHYTYTARFLEHLRRKDLLKKYSVRDVLTCLSKVHVVEVNGKDYTGEISRQTRKVIEVLEVPITKTLGF